MERLQVTELGSERRHFGKFAKRVIEPDSKCREKENINLFEPRKVVRKWKDKR